ncbi:hypothetical protein A8C32_05105 [Flavivirga aquatica]|uniref:GH16 domain-containing protein n=1 Tax=Flavivirga aquatica TaxID=1849968 RepID=A0A1E5SHJ3_9FLAO|nr:family 16 glycosylhydrolase [Flavivirga aquatica]OEJ98582.1 hypothetical protein A8C32_05105 [Flavivirga aquatica]
MNEIRKQAMVFLLLLLIVVQGFSQAVNRPNGRPSGEAWQSMANFTDEFNRKGRGAGGIWQKKPDQAAVWKWDNGNNISYNGSATAISTVHKKNGFNARIPNSCAGTQEPGKLYFRSGMLKSKGVISVADVKRGIFLEGRIKGVTRFPGFSPALWLFSDPKKNNLVGGVAYNEVDVVELTQGNSNKNETQHSVHSKRKVGGKLKFVRPSNNPTYKKKSSVSNAANFNTYGVYIDSASIIWYVNGREVARRVNDFFKQKPYHVALSLGLRKPFVAQRVCPASSTRPSDNTKIAKKPAGSATIPNQVMMVDWVRTWKKVSKSSKQVAIDDNLKEEVNDNLEVKSFPNPVNDELSFDLGIDENVEVSIFDLTGKRVYNATFFNGNINIKGLKLHGLHILKAKSALDTYNAKIIFN